MIFTHQEELDLSLYDKYSIPFDRKAYIFTFDRIIEERSYDIENEVISMGYTIHNEDLKQVSTNIFDFILIVSKADT